MMITMAQFVESATDINALSPDRITTCSYSGNVTHHKRMRIPIVFVD